MATALLVQRPERGWARITWRLDAGFAGGVGGGGACSGLSEVETGDGRSLSAQQPDERPTTANKGVAGLRVTAAAVAAIGGGYGGGSFGRDLQSGRKAQTKKAISAHAADTRLSQFETCGYFVVV